MPEPVSPILVRSFIASMSGILLHLATVAALPPVQTDRLVRAATELQQVGLSLAESPKHDSAATLP